MSIFSVFMLGFFSDHLDLLSWQKIIAVKVKLKADLRRGFCVVFTRGQNYFSESFRTPKPRPITNRSRLCLTNFPIRRHSTAKIFKADYFLPDFFV